MAELIRIGPSRQAQGIGFVRQGVITTVPDHLVADLLATGEWVEVTTPEVERVTEPAPATPAKRPTPKRKKR